MHLHHVNVVIVLEFFTKQDGADAWATTSMVVLTGENSKIRFERVAFYAKTTHSIAGEFNLRQPITPISTTKTCKSSVMLFK
jgi:hypothetical protein